MVRLVAPIVLVIGLVAVGCDWTAEAPAPLLEYQMLPIIGGQKDNGHPAVGVVMGWGHMCTATLVSPKIVLTAAHCILSQDPLKNFGLGPSIDNATAIYNVAQQIPHPQYAEAVVDNYVLNVHDIAVVVLDKAATVQPMKYRTASLNGMAGTPVTFVGYGETVPGNDASTGTKMYVNTTIGKVNSYGWWNFTNPNNPKNTCQGDSGGPGILSQGGTEEVISVVSAGDPNCLTDGWNTRVDTHASWIQGLIQQYDSGSVNPTCGNGYCEAGETQQSCPADCTQTQPGLGTPCASGDDCAAGQVCVGTPDGNYCTQFCSDPDRGAGCPDGWVCVPLEQPPPSGDGVCVKNEAPGTCGNGKCDTGENPQNCAQDCKGGACGTIAYQGCCEGELLKWCENNELQQMSCSANPSCGWNTEASFYDCGTPGAADPAGAYPKGCGGSPPQPVCGNGSCETGESQASCPADCTPAPVCGNGQCEQGETPAFCPQDCQAVQEVCGNGVCAAPETSESCPDDCDMSQPKCGNGKCESKETAASCPADCDKTPDAVCGDGACTQGESFQVCPADCDEGETPAVCGNGDCEEGEACETCQKDCGMCVYDEDNGSGGGNGPFCAMSDRPAPAVLMALLLLALATVLLIHRQLPVLPVRPDPARRGHLALQDPD